MMDDIDTAKLSDQDGDYLTYCSQDPCGLVGVFRRDLLRVSGGQLGMRRRLRPHMFVA